MSIAINKHTLERRESVNTPDFSPDDWWINPVEPDCLQKYWENKNGELVECSPERRQLIDERDLNQARHEQLQFVENYLNEIVANAYPDYSQRNFLLQLWLATEQGNQEAKAYIYPLIAWIANGQTLMREAKQEINAATTLEELSTAGYDHEAFALWHQTQPNVTNAGAEELLNG